MISGTTTLTSPIVCPILIMTTVRCLLALV